MKIYTQVIDIALQSPKRFWVAPYSDFKIGVKIVKKGTPVANEFTVKQGSTTLTADETQVDGFTTYTLKSGATGSVEYVVEVADVAEKQRITQIVTDSTVFDVGGEGGSGGVTEQWVQDYVSAETSAFVTDTELGTVLEAYPTTSEMNTAISSATSDKVTGAGVGWAPEVRAMATVYATPWITLSSNADANTCYVVLPDPESTRVKYTAESGLPDWLSSVSGTLNGQEGIPNWWNAEYVNVGSLVTDMEYFNMTFGTLKGVTIPEGVTTIGMTCFENGSGLSSLVIPSSVTSIGEGAFSDLLISITMTGKTMAEVQAMTNYPWYAASGTVFHCTDGDITIS